MRRAPSTKARSFADATSRVRYFIPQSGAAISRAAGTCESAAVSRLATIAGVSGVGSPRSSTPSTIVFDGSDANTLMSSFGCAASIEIAVAMQRSSSGRNE